MTTKKGAEIIRMVTELVERMEKEDVDNKYAEHNLEMLRMAIAQLHNNHDSNLSQAYTKALADGAATLTDDGEFVLLRAYDVDINGIQYHLVMCC